MLLQLKCCLSNLLFLVSKMSSPVSSNSFCKPWFPRCALKVLSSHDVTFCSCHLESPHNDALWLMLSLLSVTNLIIVPCVSLFPSAILTSFSFLFSFSLLLSSLLSYSSLRIKHFFYVILRLKFSGYFSVHGWLLKTTQVPTEDQLICSFYIII